MKYLPLAPYVTALVIVGLVLSQLPSFSVVREPVTRFILNYQLVKKTGAEKSSWSFERK